MNINDFVKKKLHLGHPTRDWNPKMAPYIYTKRNGFYIIDLLYTYSYLQQAKTALYNAATQNSTFLFVGTKRVASPLVKHYAEQCNAFYINHKWSGGLLTNWQTVKGMTHSLATHTPEDLDQEKTTSKIEKQQRGARSISTLSLGKEAQNRNSRSDVDNNPLSSKKKATKKEEVRLEKQRQKLEKTVGGIRNMKRLPDIVIIIGAAEEKNAVTECNKLGIPIVTILDTNCDPQIATWGVPANDDSVASIDAILREFSGAILSGSSHRSSGEKVGNKVYSQRP